jgi:hypothetical protein
MGLPGPHEASEPVRAAALMSSAKQLWVCSQPSGNRGLPLAPWSHSTPTLPRSSARGNWRSKRQAEAPALEHG